MNLAVRTRATRVDVGEAPFGAASLADDLAVVQGSLPVAAGAQLAADSHGLALGQVGRRIVPDPDGGLQPAEDDPVIRLAAPGSLIFAWKSIQCLTASA